jgi:hypothetical protein
LERIKRLLLGKSKAELPDTTPTIGLNGNLFCARNIRN